MLSSILEPLPELPCINCAFHQLLYSNSYSSLPAVQNLPESHETWVSLPSRLKGLGYRRHLLLTGTIGDVKGHSQLSQEV